MFLRLRLIQKNYSLPHLRAPILSGLTNIYFAKDRLDLGGAIGFCLLSPLICFCLKLSSSVTFATTILVLLSGFALEYFVDMEVTTDIQRYLQRLLRSDFDGATIVKLEEDENGWIFWMGSNSYRWDSRSEELSKNGEALVRCLKGASWEFLKETGYWRFQSFLGGMELYVSIPTSTRN